MIRGYLCSIIAAPSPRILPTAVLLLLMLQWHSGPVYSQSLSLDRQRGEIMLDVIIRDVKKHYYDPAFKGIDLESQAKAAKEKLKTAESVGQIFGIIAKVFLDLNDSHTFFLPPQRSHRTEYGWRMQMIGDRCFVVGVKPGSDAEEKGLKEGDVIHQVAGYAPTRENLWVLQYLFYQLRPQAGLRIVAQSPGGQPRQFELLAKIRQGKLQVDLTSSMDLYELIREAESENRLNRHRYVEYAEDLIIWKMPAFDLPDRQIDEMMDTVSKKKALILDLRDNHGGSEQSMLRLIGNWFDEDMTIGEIHRRKERKLLIAKTRGKGKTYTGRIVVLVDSRSGSASEVLARVVQLSGRGTVIGDRTSGAVMRSKSFTYRLGTDSVVFYGASITDADLVMSDGGRLETVGVTPDVTLHLSGSDLAAKRDPVLSKGAELCGVKLAADKAGLLFPVEWRNP